MHFSKLLLKLQEFWQDQGCVIVQPYDIVAGAGTFHPVTFLRSLDYKDIAFAYTAPCRRPSDGRYGDNPNRLGSYYQFQVIIKPNPSQIQELYLKSLEYLGLDLKNNDIRFVEDNWESPTLGAWGLGWEIWLNGMEITQFTYFQQVGGIALSDIPVELTYGTERLAMYLQGKNNIFDLEWNDKYLYRDIHKQGEYEFSVYHLEVANTEILFKQFEYYKIECQQCLDKKLVLPAYDQCMMASHVFNILDARKVLAVTRRMDYILQIRQLARACAIAYKSKQDNERKAI